MPTQVIAGFQEWLYFVQQTNIKGNPRLVWFVAVATFIGQLGMEHSHFIIKDNHKDLESDPKFKLLNCFSKRKKIEIKKKMLSSPVCV